MCSTWNSVFYGLLVNNPCDQASISNVFRTHNDLVSPSLFAQWPKTVTVQNITFGTPDQAGNSDLTFDVVTAPSGARLCKPKAEVLIHDKAGKILYGLPNAADLPGDASLLGPSRMACQGE